MGYALYRWVVACYSYGYVRYVHHWCWIFYAYLVGAAIFRPSPAPEEQNGQKRFKTESHRHSSHHKPEKIFTAGVWGNGQPQGTVGIRQLLFHAEFFKRSTMVRRKSPAESPSAISPEREGIYRNDVSGSQVLARRFLGHLSRDGSLVTWARRTRVRRLLYTRELS